MTAPENPTEAVGLEVIDLQHDPEFASRQLHTRDVAQQMEGMRRLTRAFVDSPETILQELVRAAVELCGADSAGISIVRDDTSESNYYKWVATAGIYEGFLNAMLPREPSACGICLQRGTPQHFRVQKRFFDILGVEAPLVTDGILMPWHVGETRGTIFILAHGRHAAFDSEDVRMMQTLADFAAMAVRQQRQQAEVMEQASAAAAAAMANELAHQINNPLQSLTNAVYLVNLGGADTSELAGAMDANLERLTVLVQKILNLPTTLPQ